MHKPSIRVVAGIIFNQENKFLIARKKTGTPNAGLWEFPGGKVEENENDFEALHREIKEELNISIANLNACFGYSYSYPEIDIDFRFFTCEQGDGIFRLKDHDAIQWVTFEEHTRYHFAPGDVPALSLLQTHLEKY